jgi:hypothetical protein
MQTGAVRQRIRKDLIMYQRIALALSAVILAGTVSAATPESTTYPFEFTATNDSMWTGLPNATQTDIEIWSTSFDASKSGSGGFELEIPGWWIFPSIDLGYFGGGYDLGANGLVGAGFETQYTAGSVYTDYKGTVTFTYPARGTIPAADSPNFPVSTSLALDYDNSYTDIVSPDADFALLTRLRIYFTFHIWAEAFSDTIFDWEPLDNDGFDTADIGNTNLSGLGEVGVHNENWIPPVASTSQDYNYLEIFNTNWVMYLVTKYVNFKYLTLPSSWNYWIVGKIYYPIYELSEPPVAGTNSFQIHGSANILSITFYLTNVIINLASDDAIPGPNRDYSLGGFSAGFHILDLYASMLEAFEQDFTYAPTIQYCLTTTSQTYEQGPFGQSGQLSPTINTYTSSMVNVGMSTTLQLPAATDYVDVQPCFQIQQVNPDFTNTSYISYTFTAGFIPFEVYGSGSVAGHNLFSFDVCPWQWSESYTLDDYLTDPNTIDFVLTCDNPVIDNALSLELNSPTFRIYPGLGPWFSTKDCTESADMNGNAAAPNFLDPACLYLDHDNVTPNNLITLEQLNANGTATVAPGTPYPMMPTNDGVKTIYPFTIRATDQNGNYTDHTTNLIIQNTTPPYFVCLPTPIVVDHTNPLATPVNVPLPPVASNVDPNPVVTSDSLGVFPIGTTQVNFTATDFSGNTSTCFTTVTVLDYPPALDLGGPYVVNEGDSIVLTATAIDPENDPLTISWDLMMTGTFDSPGASVVFSNTGRSAVWTVQAKVTELLPPGLTGLTVIKDVDITILHMPPVLGDIIAPSGLIQAGTSLDFSAPFTYPGILDTHTGVWNWGDGTTSPAVIAETNGSGAASGAHTYTKAGLYPVTLTVTDNDGAADTKVYQFVYVFTPNPVSDNSTASSGGEVPPSRNEMPPSGTGGLIETPNNVVSYGSYVRCNGIFNVPAGALLAAPAASGLSPLSLLLEYKKGSVVPSGTVKFTLKTGALSYFAKKVSFLAIGQNNIYFIASGQINKAGDFQCFGVLNKNESGQAYVRLQITDLASGAVVFDTQPGATSDADATAPFTKKNVLKVK